MSAEQFERWQRLDKEFRNARSRGDSAEMRRILAELAKVLL